MDLSAGELQLRIEEAFPNIHIKDFTVDDSGWDYVIAIVNGSTVFRFPRSRDRVEMLKKEAAFVSSLKDFPVLLPEYSIFSTGDIFFAGYRYIPGFPLNRAKALGAGLVRDSVAILKYFSRFNSSNPPEGKIPIFTPEGWIKNHVEGMSRTFRAGLSKYLGGEYFDMIGEKINESLGNLRDSDMTLSHGDLFRGNVIINGKHSEINGVIDWESASIGDFALDIAAIGKDFQPLYTRKLVSALGLDSDTGLKSRIKFYQWFEPLYTAFHKLELGDIDGLIDMAGHLPGSKNISGSKPYR